MSQSPTTVDGSLGAEGFSRAKKELWRIARAGFSWSGHERHCAFLNLGGAGGKGPRFADMSAVSGFDFPDDGRALALVDWDWDGDLDLWVTNRTGPQLRYLHNELGEGTNFVALKLVGDGKRSNRDAIGAKVELVLPGAGGLRTVKSLSAGEGFLGQSSKWLHFGLGDVGTVEALVVCWPGGEVERIGPLAAGRRYLVRQGTGLAEPVEVPAAVRALAVAKPEATAAGVEADPASRTMFSYRYPLPSFGFGALGEHQAGSIADFRGKPVLVNLWASWCAPCVSELRGLVAREAELRAAGLDVLALSVDGATADAGGDPARAMALLKSLGYGFRAGALDRNAVVEIQAFCDVQFWISAPLPVPTSLLVDAEGRLAALYRGPVEVDQVLADVAKLPAEEDKWFALALPFPGQSYGAPKERGLGSLALRLMERGHQAMAGRYLDENAALLGARLAKGDENKYPAALYTLGAHAEEEGSLEAAVRHYEAALKADPGFADAHYNLGVLAAKARDATGAEDHYRNALAANPNHYKAINNLALLYHEDSRFREAIKLYRRGLELAPQHVDMLNNYGNLLVALGQIDEAVATFLKAEKLDPIDGRTQFNLGTAHLARAAEETSSERRDRSYAEAEKCFRLAVEREPGNASFVNSLGAAQFRLGRLREAGDAFRRALELDPNFTPARNNLRRIQPFQEAPPRR